MCYTCTCYIAEPPSDKIFSKAGTRKQARHISFTTKCLHCYAFQVARLGWPASALCVSNQSGRIYSTVAMEYAKGKISAQGREISWLNHPCYLGYKGEVGYNT